MNMAAKNTKGVQVCMTKTTATPTAVVPTAIAKAATGKAAEVTATTTGIANGDLISIPAAGTGFSEIDGKSWIVANLTSTKFDLLGSDITGSTGVLTATPTMNHYANADMVCLCLSDLKFNAEKGSVISVGTYCDPSASIPSASTTAGTVDLAGFVDIASLDYPELLAAEVKGDTHIFRITLPNNGSIIFPGTIASFGWQIPLDGAVAYEASIALGSRPVHRF
jgi:hypothetical protein